MHVRESIIASIVVNIDNLIKDMCKSNNHLPYQNILHRKELNAVKLLNYGFTYVLYRASNGKNSNLSKFSNIFCQASNLIDGIIEFPNYTHTLKEQNLILQVDLTKKAEGLSE